MSQPTLEARLERSPLLQGYRLADQLRARLLDGRLMEHTRRQVEAVLERAEGETATAAIGMLRCDLWVFLGDLPNARDDYHAALEILREAPDPEVESAVRNGLGSVYLQLRRLDEALEQYRQAAQLAEQTGDLARQSKALNNMGVAYTWQEKYAEAERVLLQAVELKRRLHDRLGEAQALQNLVLVYDKLGDLHKAVELQEAVVTMFTEMGVSPGQLDAARGLLGRLKEAYGSPQP